MAGSVFQLGLTIKGSLDGSFARSISGAKMSLNEMTEVSKNLSAVKLDVDNYRKLRDETAANKKEMDELAARIRAAGPHMGNLSGSSAALIVRFKELQNSTADNKKRMAEMAESFRAAGYDVENLDRSSARLGQTMQRLEKMSDLRSRLDANNAAMEKSKQSWLALTAAIAGYIKMGQKMISLQGDILKSQSGLAVLGVAESNIEGITSEAKKFSNTWAGTTAPEFIQAATSIKSGIDGLGDTAVGEFTRIAALTGTATKSTVGEMADMFGKGFNIYKDQFAEFGKTAIAGWEKLSDDERKLEFGKWFGSGIAAAAKKFGGSGAEMSAAMAALGTTATAAGMSFADQLAVLGELRSKMGSDAGSELQAFLSSASQLGSSGLGLDVINEETGMLKSLPDILDAISERYDGVIDQAARDDLQGVFGNRGMKLVDLLLPRRDMLRKAGADLAESFDGGLEGMEEMAKLAQRGQGFTLLGQQIGNLAGAIGKTLYPAAELAAGVIGKVATTVQSLTERFPKLTGIAVGVVGGIIGITLAAKALSIGILFARGAMLKLRIQQEWMMATNPRLAASTGMLGNAMSLTAIKTKALAIAQKAWAIGSAIVMGATKAITAGFRIMSLAVASNPIGLIITGIALAAVLVIKYWEPIKAFFARLWGAIQPLFSVGSAYIRKAFSFTPIGFLIKHWEPIKAFFIKLWDGIKTALSWSPWGLAVRGAIAGAKLIIKHWEPIKAFFSGLWNRVKEIFTESIGKIFKIFEPVKKLFSWIGGGVKNAFSGAAEALTAGAPAPAYALAGAGAAPPAVFEPQRRNVTSTTSISAPITVNTHPGMDAKAVAQEIDQELRKRESQAAARQRGALYD